MLHDRGQMLAVARASDAVTELLEDYGITASIGADHLYATNRAALAAFLATERHAPDG
jgi:hypothetical protein